MAIALRSDFLKEYGDFPEHMTPIGKFTYLRTYSRYDEILERRETWKETVLRASEYNVGLAEEHLKKIGVPVDYKKLDEETMKLFKNQFMLKQALSGRTLWVGGAKNGVANKFPLANFNCSFTTIEEWEDLAELFYLLLVGTGVGFKSIPSMARKMMAVRDDFEIAFDEFNPLPKGLRSDETRLGIDIELAWDAQAMEYATSEVPGSATIHVGDSKEGWVDAVRKFFALVTEEQYEHIKTIRFSFDSVRPAGEPLKTFGGTASGHQPLLEMFEVFEQVIKNTLDDSIEPWERVGENRVRIRPIGIADMANAIGYNVVVGGVRRTAEIYLFSGDPGEIDYESMFMKFGINGIYGEVAFKHLEKVRKEAEKNNIPLPKFFDSLQVQHFDVYDAEGTKHTFTDKQQAIDFASEAGVEDYFPFPYNAGRPLHHRRMSNNSIAFHTNDKPLKRFLDFIFLMMKGEGEPGFINLYEASRRRLEQMGITDPEIIAEYALKIGLNPCAEILLYSKGVCNLTTVNVKAFVYYVDGVAKLDLEGLMEAQRLSARSGLRMTLVELELPKWNEVQQRDRLLGTSLTGWKDAMSALGYSPRQERRLLKKLGREGRSEADRYAKEMRVPAPLLVTTVKPEGTLSIVFGAVSSGLHVAHSPFYIRGIRINAQDPLAKTVLAMRGWRIHAEVGTLNYTREEDLRKPEVIAQARTLVIDFPVASGAKKTKAETLVDEQFDTYFAFQKNYTEHNTSNTIHLQDKFGEWDKACERVYDGWEDFVGVSFLSLDNNTYTLAPYRECSEDQYNELWNGMEQLDFDVLKMFDKRPDGDLALDGMESCEGGVCPIR
jgi:ribonucleoside-triphosphate reductase (thioredoxin)